MAMVIAPKTNRVVLVNSPKRVVCIISNAMKLNGGPGIMGKIHPTKPRREIKIAIDARK